MRPSLLLRLLALLPAALLPAACGALSDAFGPCGITPVARIPVEMRGNTPLIHATIKGRPATLMLDTGSVSVALTEQAMRRFGLERDPSVTVLGAGVGGRTRGAAGRIEDFRIGDLPVPDHQVSVLPAAAGISRSGVVDGLFGVSVLSNYEVELDLPRHEVTLYEGNVCRSTAAPPWVDTAAVVAAARSERGRFLVPVELDGRPLTALLDTGAAVSVLAGDVANALGVSQAMLDRDRQVSLAGTGPSIAIAWVHRFHQIAFAGQSFDDPVLVVSARADPTVDMIIGTDYLAHRRLWLSYARKLVFVDRPSED